MEKKDTNKNKGVGAKNANQGKETVKIQVHMPKEVLDDIVSKLGGGGKVPYKAIVANALALLKFMLDERGEQRVICSMDAKKKVIKQIVLPTLEPFSVNSV